MTTYSRFRPRGHIYELLYVAVPGPLKSWEVCPDIVIFHVFWLTNTDFTLESCLIHLAHRSLRGIGLK
jgi:hypothetical protein